MPTKTFLNLPKEKRIKILKGAKTEFSRVCVDKAVIANISIEAEIPRGSFYQYFFSVADLYVYLIEYLYEVEKKKFELYLQENNNDVYLALKVKFSKKIEKLSKAVNKQLEINNRTYFLNNTLYSPDVLKYIIEKNNQLDINIFPEEFRNVQNFDKFLSLIQGLNEYCIEMFIKDCFSANEIIEYYNNNIDFIKYSISLIYS